MCDPQISSITESADKITDTLFALGKVRLPVDKNVHDLGTLSEEMV